VSSSGGAQPLLSSNHWWALAMATVAVICTRRSCRTS
jgi:hypothetical protein